MRGERAVGRVQRHAVMPGTSVSRACTEAFKFLIGAGFEFITHAGIDGSHRLDFCNDVCHYSGFCSIFLQVPFGRAGESIFV